MKRMMFTLMLIISLSMLQLSAYACEGGTCTDSNEIVPRAAICTACGGYMFDSYSYGEWYIVSEIKCSHDAYEYGTDIIWERTVTRTTTCNTCSRGGSSSYTEQKVDCHGYNIP